MTSPKKKDLTNLEVAEMMTRRVTCLSSSDTLHRALEIMAEEKLAALPVVSHTDQCLGILSRSDLADLFVGLDECVDQMSQNHFRVEFPDGFETTVGELMNSEVVSISAHDPVIKAAKKMAEHRIHHLPVVDQQGILVGIISTLDVAEAVSQL
jgi:CBS domain-containing protein